SAPRSSANQQKAPSTKAQGFSYFTFTTANAVPYSPPAAVKRVFVAPQKSLAVLFLVAGLRSIALAGAVIAILVCVMLFRLVILALGEIALPGAQSVAIARIKRHIGIAPVVVVAFVFLVPHDTIGIVIAVQPINIRTDWPVLEAVLISVSVA